MKTSRVTMSMALAVFAAAIFTGSCKKDDGSPSQLKVMSVMTDGGIDLTTAAAAISIPVNASFIVTFDKAVDPSTVNANSVAITADGAAVPSTVTVNGTAVTIKPTISLASGTNHTISLAATLKATDGGSATASDFTYKTFGRTNAIPPQSANQLSYFAFSGNMNDAIGGHSPAPADVKDLTFAADRFGFAGSSGDFNGSTTLVEIPNGEQYLANNNFTLSMWIKANSTKNGQFVLGLGAWKGFEFEIASDWSSVKLAAQFSEGGGLSDSEDNAFPGTGLTRDNGAWQGWTFQKDVLPHGGGVGTTYFKDKWVHIVCTYESSTKLTTLYLNGEKVKEQDFNYWPDADLKKNITGVKFAGNLTGGGNKLALGFIQGSQNRILTDSWADPADAFSNHFKGQMDDLRIFKVALTATETATLYAAEKP